VLTRRKAMKTITLATASAAVDFRSLLQPPAQTSGAVYKAPALFTDISSQAKIIFRHFNGAQSDFYLPEIMGSGAAFLDYDGDGYLDIFLVNGGSLSAPRLTDPTCMLFRNNRDRTFTNVTEQVKVNIKGFSGMGVAVADYDNDGYPDLYVTGYPRSYLLRNNGDGTFRDVTETAGVMNMNHWASSAGFFDYDRDGLLDLFVCNYVSFDPHHNPVCQDGGFRSYCHPSVFRGDHCTLYHNNGDGTFSDVTHECGIGSSIGKALGVAFADYDEDGWPDIFVANDSVPNFLFHNKGNGTFEEVGLPGGVAYDQNGHPRAGMGADFGDYDGDGRLDLLVTNFANEGNALFHNNGDGSFSEVTYQTGILNGSFLNVGFGVGFFDCNNDGNLDVFVANGHVAPGIEKYRDDFSFKQKKLLYINQGGYFEELSKDAGSCFAVPNVGRGVAFGDIDNDGNIDVLVTNNGGLPELLRNNGSDGNHWLTLKLVGHKSNRDGIGASIKARVKDRLLVTQVQTAGSYLSSRDPRPHFGLGRAEEVSQLDIQWPSGIVQTIRNVRANQILVVHEATR